VTTQRVFLYVQHLLGIGHLRRTSIIARALDDAGFAVTVASGGEPVADLALGRATLVQLPPALAADVGFSGILDAARRPIDDDWRQRRRAALLAAFAADKPDIVLIELFPFGRWPFRFELLPLLEAAHARRPRPLIVCSLRDILVDKPDAKRRAEIIAIVRRHFDRLLVHGDPTLFRLEESFPSAASLADLIDYTGYVVEPPTAAGGAAGRGEVIVSAGGGAVGAPLLRAALAARPLCRAAAAPWRLITGPSLAAPVAAALAAAAPPGVVVERFRCDFPTLLRNCCLSLSQGGYNTVMELLTAGARAVIVPFAAGQEIEQTMRARRLAERGLVQVVETGELTPRRLAAAIDAALAQPAPSPSAIALDGAAAAARRLAELVAP
jgi:predicted glycosyltransferase